MIDREKFEEKNLNTEIDVRGGRVEKRTSEIKQRKVRQMVCKLILECLLRRKKNWIYLDCNNELQLITMTLEGMDNGMRERGNTISSSKKEKKRT